MGKNKNKGGKKRSKGEGGFTRIAVVDVDRCKPNKCMLECKVFCPVVITGKKCVKVEKDSKKTYISEILCQGCGICVRKCPFKAIQIINLPKSLEGLTTHRYGANGFKLHRLPMPRPGLVLGLVGTNGIGKTTALRILSAKIKPNLGVWENKPSWEEVCQYFRGTELQSYFQHVVEDKIRVSLKPQYIDRFLKEAKRAKKGLTVKRYLKKYDERGKMEEMSERLDLKKLYDREIKALSGGELQRVFIGKTALAEADIYMFDEPSSYLDVSQRITTSHVIRDCLYNDKKYVLCVEHDLAILDFLSDFICVLFGKAGAYGIVSLPFGCREGINIFLSGFIPTENVRFREFQMDFKLSSAQQQDAMQGKNKNQKDDRIVKVYPKMKKTFKDRDDKEKTCFELDIEKGDFKDSEIIVLLGENGTGKTTFIQMLANKLEPDGGENEKMEELKISFKPQTIQPKFRGSVRQLFEKKIKDTLGHPQFQTDVFKPLDLDYLMDRKVRELSGGELQRVAICLALGQPADVYLLDEPSAYLDALQRMIVAKVIKRFILHTKRTAFVVEHDFIMATYLADRVIVFDGQPSVKCQTGSPVDMVTGMNQFLKQLQITFRRDPRNYRPRINKRDSVKDREQKLSGNYFFHTVSGDDEVDDETYQDFRKGKKRKTDNRKANVQKKKDRQRKLEKEKKEKKEKNEKKEEED